MLHAVQQGAHALAPLLPTTALQSPASPLPEAVVLPSAVLHRRGSPLLSPFPQHSAPSQASIHLHGSAAVLLRGGCGSRVKWMRAHGALCCGGVGALLEHGRVWTVNIKPLASDTPPRPPPKKVNSPWKEGHEGWPGGSLLLGTVHPVSLTTSRSPLAALPMPLHLFRTRAPPRGKARA